MFELHQCHDNTDMSPYRGRLNTQPKKLLRVLTKVFLEVLMTFHNGRLLSTTDLQCACGAPRPDWRAWEGCYVRLMKRCW